MGRLTAFQRELSRSLLDQGLKVGAIARQMGCNPSTIRRLRRRVQETGSVADRPRSGPPRVTTDRQDRVIRRAHLRARMKTAISTARETRGTHGRLISSRTVRRRLREGRLRARTPYRGPVLTAGRRERRLNWARTHRNWTLQRWRGVLYSDESRICLDRPDRRLRVWRRRGERYSDPCILEQDRWGGVSILVWGGITYHSRTPLVVIDGNLNAQRYITEVLEPTLLPFLAQHPEISFFQQDNARPHSARATREFLDDNDVRTLSWPAFSPDMAPIEHLWDQLKSAISRRLPPPATRRQLIEAATEEWDNIPQARIQALINSMRRRCSACVDANGGHTSY